MQLSEFWQIRANKAYHQGYNGESRFWNSYHDDNRNGMPDWIEQSPESVRGYLTHAYRLGASDQQRGFRRSEPYDLAALELPETTTMFAHAEVDNAPESGLPSEVDRKPSSPDQGVIV